MSDGLSSSDFAIYEAAIARLRSRPVPADPAEVAPPVSSDIWQRYSQTSTDTAPSREYLTMGRNTRTGRWTP